MNYFTRIDLRIKTTADAETHLRSMNFHWNCSWIFISHLLFVVGLSFGKSWNLVNAWPFSKFTNKNQGFFFCFFGWWCSAPLICFEWKESIFGDLSVFLTIIYLIQIDPTSFATQFDIDVFNWWSLTCLARFLKTKRFK